LLSFTWIGTLYTGGHRNGLNCIYVSYEAYGDTDVDGIYCYDDNYDDDNDNDDDWS
jgi:hypothetical protein